MICRHANGACGLSARTANGWLPGSEDRQVWVTDLAAGRRLKIVPAEHRQQRDVFPRWQNAGRGLRSPDIAVHLWNVADWNPTQLPGHPNNAHGLAFGSHLPLLATCSMDGTVRFWDLAAKSPHKLTIGPFGKGVWNVAFSPKGGYLVTANDNGTISILKVPTSATALFSGAGDQASRSGRTRQAAQSGRCPQTRGHPGRIAGEGGGGDPQKAPAELVAVLWDKDGQGKAVTSVVISPDGETIAAATDRTIYQWNVKDGSPRKPCIGHTGPILALAFSSDGKLLASASNDDGTVRLWEAAAGMELPLGGPPLPYSWGVAFSPDSRLLASCSHDGSIQIWNVAAAECSGYSWTHYSCQPDCVQPGRQVAGLRVRSMSNVLCSGTWRLAGKWTNSAMRNPTISCMMWPSALMGVTWQ